MAEETRNASGLESATRGLGRPKGPAGEGRAGREDVNVVDKKKARAALDKVRKRDAELLKRLAR